MERGGGEDEPKNQQKEKENKKQRETGKQEIAKNIFIEVLSSPVRGKRRETF